MGKYIVTGSVNSSTGAITWTSTANIPNTENISGVQLRENIPSGPTRDNFELTDATTFGSTFTLTGHGTNGVIRDSVRVVDESGNDIPFTLNAAGEVISYDTARTSTTDDYTITFSDYSEVINYDVKVRPTNVTAVVDGVIILKNGPQGGFTQQYRVGTGAALTTNAVVSHIITTA